MFGELVITRRHGEDRLSLDRREQSLEESLGTARGRETAQFAPALSVVNVVAMISGAVYLSWMLVNYALPVADFPLFHFTAHALLHGQTPAYPAMPVPRGILYNLAPPHFHILLAPLADLSMPLARWIWRGVSVVGLLTAVSLAGVRWRASWISAAIWCSGSALLLLCGQIAGILALPVGMVLRASRSNRWVAAGAWAGVLISIKPFFGLLVVWFLLERRWRAVVAAIASTGLVFAAGWVWVGSGPYLEWIGALSQVNSVGTGLNSSWPSLVERALPAAVEPFATLAGIGIISALTLRGLRRADVSTRLLGTILAAFLISPIGWTHYLWMVAAPLAVWLDRGNRLPPLAWLFWVPPVVVEYAFVTGQWIVPSAYAIALLALWWRVVTPMARRPVQLFS